MTTKDTKDVIAHVRAAVTFTRQAKHMGLRELFRECGVSIPTLSRIERGHSMDAETFLKLIEWLHNHKDAPPRGRTRKKAQP